jgi:hypothetical protein
MGTIWVGSIFDTRRQKWAEGSEPVRGYEISDKPVPLVEEPKEEGSVPISVYGVEDRRTGAGAAPTPPPAGRAIRCSGRSIPARRKEDLR